MPRFDETEQQKRLDALRRKDEEELIRVLSGKYGHQYINLRGISIDTDALGLVDEARAHAAEVAVFDKLNKRLRVAIRNPNNAETKTVLRKLGESGYELEIFMASTASLEHAWSRYQDVKKATSSEKGVLDIAADEVEQFVQTIATTGDIATAIETIAQSGSARAVTETLEAILGGALALGASDVHLEPEDTLVRVRVRIDGVLTDVSDIQSELFARLRSRIKLLSGLKLNVVDRAQDGRFTIDAAHKELEIRTSIIPGAFGESVVMRILDPSTIKISMEDLGINQRLFDVLEEELRRPNGMIVTTGPTGSGKTTSLYAFLKRTHRPEIKVVTLEDPIEYHLDGIVQTQVGGEYTFATGLRAILRQDPDIIMVGEIRDRDVAESAVHAALTGHLVFSTLHTNSAVGAFPRLMDLGVDSRLMGSALNLVIAQRLARRLCTACRKERTATLEEADMIRSFLGGMPDAPDTSGEITLYDAVGCDACNHTGYRGRIGLYEGIRVDSAVETAVIEDPREDNILAAAVAQKIPSMQQDGLIKALAGITSIDELTRVIDLYGSKGVRRMQTEPTTE